MLLFLFQTFLPKPLLLPFYFFNKIFVTLSLLAPQYAVVEGCVTQYKL